MNYVLIFLIIFGALAWFFKENAPKNETIEKLSRKCPCSRLAKEGVLTKILIYTSVFVFVLNGLYLEYIDFGIDNIIQLILALILAFLGYKVKKEEI